jgi:hypothetical protein
MVDLDDTGKVDAMMEMMAWNLVGGSFVCDVPVVPVSVVYN